MSTQSIWRVETIGKLRPNGLGRGMYHMGVQFWDANGRHPCPGDDRRLAQYFGRGNTPASKWHYGFSSLAQLRSWIYKQEWLEEAHYMDEGGPEEDRLHLQEYVLDTFPNTEEPTYVLGDTQAVFLPRYARMGRSCSLLDIPDTLEERENVHGIS